MVKKWRQSRSASLSWLAMLSFEEVIWCPDLATSRQLCAKKLLPGLWTADKSHVSETPWSAKLGRQHEQHLAEFRVWVTAYRFVCRRLVLRSGITGSTGHPVMANHTGTTVNSQLRIRDIFLSTLSFLREVVLLLVFVVTDLVVTASRWLVPVRYQAKCLDGHVVVVTGSGSGIGRLMALEFAKRRCRVVLWGKHLDDVGPVAQEITSLGGEAYAYECDCSCRDSVFQTAARMEAEVGTADIVVNNAGVVHGKVISDCSAGIVEETMGVNLLQNFWVGLSSKTLIL